MLRLMLSIGEKQAGRRRACAFVPAANRFAALRWRACGFSIGGDICPCRVENRPCKLAPVFCMIKSARAPMCLFSAKPAAFGAKSVLLLLICKRNAPCLFRGRHAARRRRQLPAGCENSNLTGTQTEIFYPCAAPPQSLACALAFAAIEHRVCPARTAYGACPCFHFTVWFVYYIIFFFPCQSPCRYTYINIWKTAAGRTEKRLSPYKL